MRPYVDPMHPKRSLRQFSFATEPPGAFGAALSSQPLGRKPFAQTPQSVTIYLL